MSDVDMLKHQYAEMRLANGFQTDANFMNAWRQDPVKWAHIFSVRMQLINALAA